MDTKGFRCLHHNQHRSDSARRYHWTRRSLAPRSFACPTDSHQKDCAIQYLFRSHRHQDKRFWLLPHSTPLSLEYLHVEVVAREAWAQVLEEGLAEELEAVLGLVWELGEVVVEVEVVPEVEVVLVPDFDVVNQNTNGERN